MPRVLFGFGDGFLEIYGGIQDTVGTQYVTHPDVAESLSLRGCLGHSLCPYHCVTDNGEVPCDLFQRTPTRVDPQGQPPWAGRFLAFFLCSGKISPSKVS